MSFLIPVYFQHTIFPKGYRCVSLFDSLIKALHKSRVVAIDIESLKLEKSLFSSSFYNRLFDRLVIHSLISKIRV